MKLSHATRKYVYLLVYVFFVAAFLVMALWMSQHESWENATPSQDHGLGDHASVERPEEPEGRSMEQR